MRSWLILLSCTLLASAARDARGTAVRYMSPPDLGDEAALVVRGVVENVESRWNPPHTKIFTRIRLRVDATYKGHGDPTIEVIQLGGTAGNVQVTVQGALPWEAGEEVLVFLEPYDASAFQICGFSQGKFWIVRDLATGAAFVERPPLEGLRLRGQPSSPAPARALTERRVPLEQFLEEALPEVER